MMTPLDKEYWIKAADMLPKPIVLAKNQMWTKHPPDSWQIIIVETDEVKTAWRYSGGKARYVTPTAHLVQKIKDDEAELAPFPVSVDFEIRPSMVMRVSE